MWQGLVRRVTRSSRPVSAASSRRSAVPACDTTPRQSALTLTLPCLSLHFTPRSAFPSAGYLSFSSSIFLCKQGTPSYLRPVSAYQHETPRLGPRHALLSTCPLRAHTLYSLVTMPVSLIPAEVTSRLADLRWLVSTRPGLRSFVSLVLVISRRVAYSCARDVPCQPTDAPIGRAARAS